MADISVGINSYVTLESANSYISDNYPSISAEYQAWFSTSLSDSDKCAMLIQSTFSMNNIKYTGIKSIKGQPLAFPRVQRFGAGPAIVTTLFISQSGDNSLADTAGNNNGLTVAGYAEIENALAYCCLNKTVIPEARERRLSGLTSEKIGSATTTYTRTINDSTDAESGIYTKKVKQILRAWITESVYAL